MHLQDTYFAEKGDIGDGDAISYKAPPTNVFEYDVATAGTFTATAQQPLDECAQESVWQIVGTKGSKAVSYTPSITGGATGACAALTPNFTKIGAGS